MKKLILFVLCTAFFTTVYADDTAKLNIKIADPVKANSYFLCLAGTGCFSIKAANNGKIFPIIPTDLGNITQFVILDGSTLELYRQPTNASCNIQMTDDQKETIS